MGIIEGIVESAVENTVRHEVEDAANTAIDKKAKEGDTTAAKVAKGAQKTRHAIVEGRAAANLVESGIGAVKSGNALGIVDSVLSMLRRWFHV
ncbi:MAG: hypothetical protein KBT12_08030 [Bacteroidales bacterium]|nr:hypothetical protein [Candidatus Physcousia equi]